MKRLSSLLLALLLLTASFVVGVPAAHGDVQDQLPLTLIEKEGFMATVTSVDDTAQEDWMLAVGLHLVGTEAEAEVSLNGVSVNGWTIGNGDFQTKELRSALLDKNGLDATVYILSSVKDSYQISEIDTVEFIFQIRSVEDGRAGTEKGMLTLSESPVEAPVSLRYDARLFFDDWNMTTPICLTYATNRTDIPAMVTLAVTAIDAGGEPIPIFDMMLGRTRQVNQFSLCVPAGVQVLQRREPGGSRAAVPAQDGLHDFDVQRLTHLVDLIEELLSEECHVLRVKICLKRQVENGLGQIVADVGGIFGPLIFDDIFHKEDADGRPRKECLDRLDAFALYR